MPNAIPPAEALARLMDGNKRYSANLCAQHDFSVGWHSRVQAQYPIAAILSCADARLAPEFVFDQGAGELFVVRVAGNVLSADLLASLEYGVQFLGIPLLMVLGHTNCGAVTATIQRMQEGLELPGHLPQLAGSIEPAVLAAQKQQPDCLLYAAVEENVRRQVNSLRHTGPVISQYYSDKRIDIVGAVYNLETARASLVA